MNLIELKEKISAHLATLTIDDFYLDSSLATTKALFQDLTGCGDDREIEKYLINEIPNTDFEAYVNSIRESIALQQPALAAANQQLAKTKAQLESLDKKMAEILVKQKAIPEKQKEIEGAILQIGTEIKQIRPLANNAIYAQRITELEKEKAKYQQQLDTLPGESSELSEEITSLKIQKKSLQNQVGEDQVQVNVLSNDLFEKENLLKDAETKKTNHFKKQADALNFLLGLLLGMKAKNSNYAGYDKNQPLERLDKNEATCLITSALANNTVCPQNWRKLLQDIFSQPIPEFSGSLTTPDYERETYLVREKLPVSDVDLGAILALTIAIESGQSLQLQINLIGLALPGGLLAKIVFRNKTASLTKFQKAEFELFAKGYKGYHDRSGMKEFWRNKSETLYHQSGYADSELEITIPYGYYILASEYIIEITFEAAPMLLGAASLARFTPNIAGAAKKQKDKEDDDAYWDDDDD